MAQPQGAFREAEPVPPCVRALAIQYLVRGEQETHREELKESLVLAVAMPDTDWALAMCEVFQLRHELDSLCQVALEVRTLVKGNAINVIKQIDGSSLCSPRVCV